MKSIEFCQRHMDLIRSLLSESGLLRLVSSTPEELAQRLESGESDPLLEVMSSIVNTFLSYCDPNLLPQQFCPICEVMAHPCQCGEPECTASTAKDAERTWTSDPVGNVLKSYQERGLIPPLH